MKKLLIAVACLTLACEALGQTNSSAPKPEQPPAAQATPSENDAPSVAPDAAVITIDGLCEKPANSSATPADCKTVVTRADFEKLINAVQPNLPQAARKPIAQRYAMMLYLAEKAHEAGLDQGPDFEEKASIARMQLLAQLGSAREREEAAKVTDGEIANYYQEHAADYATISFDRLRIPKQKRIAATPAKTGAAASASAKKPESGEETMKAEAEKLRARAAAGEDFAKLQQEAYDLAGYTQIKGGDLRVNQVRKPTLPPADQSIFDLKKGEVSKIFDDGGEFVVYKIEAVEAMPLADARDEISRKLTSERDKAMMDNLQKSTKLDDVYFAPPPAPPTLKAPGEAAPAVTPAPGKN